MGKGGKKKGGGRRTRPTNYAPIARENERLQKYYDDLGIVPEEERDQFWEALRRDLPNSFRFTGSRRHALAVQERLKDLYIPNITSIEYEGALVEPPRPLPWYPDQLAWAMTTPRKVVRRFAPFASFQKFLVSETEVGNISRQEVVSMIPPLFMDVKPGMVVLDMCAAPGSKAGQLMEMIHAGEEERMDIIANKRQSESNDEMIDKEEEEDVKVPKLFPRDVQDGTVDDDGRSTGLLIANDSDYKRAHLLIHQMKRLNSPNLIVTNHDATMYPSIKLTSEIGRDGHLVPNRYLKFDRILADVPCSGDGTLRKNIDVWKNWNPANALGLHATQSRILVRALQMLKVGGRVVYSTCSMNPVENEAVIASVIDRCGGTSKVEIVDCDDQLPALKRSPGLTTWSVMDKQRTAWKSWGEFEEQNTAPSRIVEGMFPSDEEGVDLRRCMRVNPHQQDTGGFFIAVLEKKSEIRARPENLKKGEWTPAPTKSSAKEPNGEVKQNDKGDYVDKPSDMPAQLNPQDQQRSVPSDDSAAASSTKRKADQLDDEPVTKRPRVSDETTTYEGEASVPSPVRTKRKADQLDDEHVAKQPRVSDETTTHKEGASGISSSTVGTRTVASETIPTKATESVSAPPQKKSKSGQPIEEPFKYVDPNHEELEDIFNFYDISPQFPRDRFMVRNAEGRLAKTIYYTSVLGREILTENEGTGMKFVHCGIKMFVKQDVQKASVCPWRIQTDGLQILAPWVGSHRIVTIHQRETLRRLLIEMFPKVSDGGWKELGEIGEWARDVDQGCCVLRLEPSDREDGFEEPMVFPLWRSNHSLNLMLPKEDRRALLLRLFDDETPLVNTTAKREASKAVSTNEQPNAANGDAGTESITEGTEPGDLPSKEEEEAIKRDNLVLGQEEQDAMSSRESYMMADDEPDVMNTTV